MAITETVLKVAKGTKNTVSTTHTLYKDGGEVLEAESKGIELREAPDLIGKAADLTESSTKVVTTGVKVAGLGGKAAPVLESLEKIGKVTGAAGAGIGAAMAVKDMWKAGVDYQMGTSNLAFENRENDARNDTMNRAGVTPEYHDMGLPTKPEMKEYAQLGQLEGNMRRDLNVDPSTLSSGQIDAYLKRDATRESTLASKVADDRIKATGISIANSTIVEKKDAVVHWATGANANEQEKQQATKNEQDMVHAQQSISALSELKGNFGTQDKGARGYEERLQQYETVGKKLEQDFPDQYKQLGNLEKAMHTPATAPAMLSKDGLDAQHNEVGAAAKEHLEALTKRSQQLHAKDAQIERMQDVAIHTNNHAQLEKLSGEHLDTILPMDQADKDVKNYYREQMIKKNVMEERGKVEAMTPAEQEAYFHKNAEFIKAAGLEGRADLVATGLSTSRNEYDTKAAAFAPTVLLPEVNKEVGTMQAKLAHANAEMDAMNDRWGIDRGQQSPDVKVAQDTVQEMRAKMERPGIALSSDDKARLTIAEGQVTLAQLKDVEQRKDAMTATLNGPQFMTEKVLDESKRLATMTPEQQDAYFKANAAQAPAQNGELHSTSRAQYLANAEQYAPSVLKDEATKVAKALNTDTMPNLEQANAQLKGELKDLERYAKQVPEMPMQNPDGSPMMKDGKKVTYTEYKESLDKAIATQKTISDTAMKGATDARNTPEDGRAIVEYAKLREMQYQAAELEHKELAYKNEGVKELVDNGYRPLDQWKDPNAKGSSIASALTEQKPDAVALAHQNIMAKYGKELGDFSKLVNFNASDNHETVTMPVVAVAKGAGKQVSGPS